MKDLQDLLKEHGDIKPVFDHFGLFTHDREKTAEFFLTVPGSEILVARDVEFPAEAVSIGKAVKIRLYHISVCGLDIEIVQPVDSPGSYIESILAEHGNTFHHLAMTFKERREHLAMAEILNAKGYKCTFEARVRDLLIHYFESTDGNTIAYELKSTQL